MKQLATLFKPPHQVLALTGFSIECNPVQIAQRIQALTKRLQELALQISGLRRSGEREEANDLRQYQDTLTEQLLEVQKIFKSARGSRDALYAEFYSKHGHEIPTKP